MKLLVLLLGLFVSSNSFSSDYRVLKSVTIEGFYPNILTYIGSESSFISTDDDPCQRSEGSVIYPVVIIVPARIQTYKSAFKVTIPTMIKSTKGCLLQFDSATLAFLNRKGKWKDKFFADFVLNGDFQDRKRWNHFVDVESVTLLQKTRTTRICMNNGRCNKGAGFGREDFYLTEGADFTTRFDLLVK